MMSVTLEFINGACIGIEYLNDPDFGRVLSIDLLAIRILIWFDDEDDNDDRLIPV